MSDRETPTAARDGDRVGDASRPAPAAPETPRRAWSPEVIDLRGLADLSGPPHERTPEESTSATRAELMEPRAELEETCARTNQTRPSNEGGRSGNGVRIRVAHREAALDSMTEHEKVRLFIRVLCELVAYGELADSE